MTKKHHFLFLTCLVLLASSLVVFWAGKAFSANNFKVCKQGDCAFETIEEALDLAQKGDMIILGPGEYKEDIKIEKNVTIRAEGKNQEVLGNIGFSAPSVTIPKRTAIHISEVKGMSEKDYPQAAGDRSGRGDTAKKDSQPQTLARAGSEPSSISTPLFDVNIQSKLEGKSSQEILVTLVIFFVILLTILGYLIFGFIVRHHSQKKEEDDILG